MNDFFDKMKEDSKFSAGVKLALCSLFVVFAIIYIVVMNYSNKGLMEKYGSILNDRANNDTYESYLIELPDDYSFTYTLQYNENITTYTGTVDSGTKQFTVKNGDIESKYTYFNETYYLVDNENLIKTTVESIYNIIPYTYFDINTINEYIDKGEKNGDNYIVYVKDIISDVDNNEYITFKFTNESVNIDYTNLLKLTYEDINNCTLLFEYGGKE